jgi:hypothetical protein
MESNLHQLEPNEEYENEDSLEISHGATVEATIKLVQDTAINEDPNENNVYKRKPKRLGGRLLLCGIILSKLRSVV